MTVLAASIISKSGKILISRQFIEVNRSRIEDLLSTFPKLLTNNSQHTFVETENVRYVYQSLEKIYVVLLTTKTSNILEDLQSLKHFAKVVSDLCPTKDDKDVNNNCFQIIFAFDELISLGYRENISLNQIKSYLDMESNDEKAFLAIRKNQEKEAKEEAKRRAKEIQMMQNDKTRQTITFSSTSANLTNSQKHESISSYNNNLTPINQLNSSGNAMKLGSSKNALSSNMVSKLLEESSAITKDKLDENISSQNSSVPLIKIDERMSISISRDGSFNNQIVAPLEIKGSLIMNISSNKFSRCVVQLENVVDDFLSNIQTHPNIDKSLLQNSSILSIKPTSKDYPLESDVHLIRWRIARPDQNLCPLKVICWPSDSASSCEAVIEYEFNKSFSYINNLVFIIPITLGCQPVIGHCSIGSCEFDKLKGHLKWTIVHVDSSDSTGSLEISVSGIKSYDLFPINIKFGPIESCCPFKVAKIFNQSEPSSPIGFKFESLLNIEKFEIV